MMNRFYRGSVYAAIFLVLSCTVFMGSGCSRGGSAKIPPSEWYPAILAEEAVALAGGESGDDVQAVLIRMHSIGGRPKDRAKKDSMGQTLSLYEGLTVIAEETIGKDLDPMQSAMATLRGGLPADEYLQAAQRHPEADVLLSLDGGPSLKGRNIAAMASKLPPTICVLANSEGAQALLASGVADVVIVPLTRGLVHEDPQTAREQFENGYRIFKK